MYCHSSIRQKNPWPQLLGLTLFLLGVFGCGADSARAVDSFSAAEPMRQGRQDHTATRLPDGRVLVVGGRNGAASLTSAEIYDGVSGRWRDAGSLSIPRSGHAAVLLKTGKVIVTGGRAADGSALASTEIYDVATGVWSMSGAMKSPRMGHTATLTSAGTVIAVGGVTAESATAALNSTEIYNVTTGQWNLTGYLNDARSFHTATQVSNELVIIGGRSGNSWVPSIEVYDTSRGSSWSIAIPGSGASPDRSRDSHTATLLRDQRILLAGGSKTAPLATVGFYKRYSWSGGGSMTASRTSHAAALLSSDRVLVTGGVDGSGAPLASAELFSGQWTAAPSMAVARAGHTATAISGGRILIAGGYGTSGTLTSCEIFNPRAETWAEMSPMIVGRLRQSATLLTNGRVLVCGGADNFGYTRPGTVEIYDPVADVWQAAATFAPRMSHTAVLLANGKLLVAGGVLESSQSKTYLGRSDVYDPVADTWTPTGAMVTPRSGAAAVLLQNGSVFVVGGSDAATSSTGGLQSAEVYDPAAGVWTVVNPMSRPRVGPGIALLTDGRVLVASNFAYNDTNPPTAEIYQPGDGNWVSTGPMLFPHNGTVLTLLKDGRVLATGGTSTSKAAEIFDPQTNAWSAAGTLTSPAVAQSATLLLDGRVLLHGDEDSPFNNTGKADIYDPLTNAWTALNTIRSTAHVAVLMTDGRVIFTGGIRGTDYATVFDRAFDPYAAASRESPPVIASAYFDESDRVVLAGTGFTAGAATAPVVQYRRLDNGHTVDLLPDTAESWSDSSFLSQSLTGFPEGAGMVTVFVNGVPGKSVIISRSTPEIGVVNAGGQSLADGGGVDFGSVIPAAQVEQIFTVRNFGRADLTGLSVTMEDEVPPSFTVTANPATTLAGPSGSTEFTVRFSPASPGQKRAILHIASNDADESPFDLVLSGIGTNSAPVITAIGDQTIDEDGTTGPLSFTIGDAESPGQLVVSVSSSNESLTPPGSIGIAGSGADRTLTVTPPAGANGVAVLTVTVSDGVLETSVSFTLTVNAVNNPPTLAEIGDPAPLRENSGVQTIALTGVDSGEGAGQPVTLSVLSDNPGLFSLLEVADGMVRYQPAADASGRAVVTVTVDDGQGEPNSTFSRAFTVDVWPVIMADAAGTPEGNAGTTPLVFRLSIHAPQSGDVSVHYATASIPGQAAEGVDYLGVSGTAVIPAGATAVEISVGVVGDTAFEANESFHLILTDPVRGFLASGDPVAVTGFIFNDDAPPALTVSAGSVTETAGAGPFQVWISASLASASAVPLTWTVATRSGTAEAGSDFTALGPVALTFAPGETSKWVAVSVGGGPQPGGEKDEEFYVDFTAAGGPATMITSTCTIRRLTVTDFFALGSGLFALRFPTGIGQNYVIEESDLPGGPWVNNSAILIGSGSTVTQVVISTRHRSFFRVSAAPAAPGVPAVGP